MIMIAVNNKRVHNRYGINDHSPGDQDNYLMPLMILFPIFKFVSMFSMLMAIMVCNSTGTPKYSILKYNTMLYAGSETIFWTFLQSMLHLGVLGFGYLRYVPSKRDVKISVFVLLISYFDSSAYYVTIDNPIPS